jgi:hypothetical protein
MSGLGFFAPELCQTYHQWQPEQPDTISRILAKPTIVSKPTGVAEGEGMGIMCSINRWVSDNPIVSVAGLVASYFLLRGKR